MPNAEHSCDLADAAATRDLGRRLAAAWLADPRWPTLPAGSGPPPLLLLLQGDLGAGKTCLVQGLAEGLGITEPITSPTFALAQHYEGRLAEGEPTCLVHLDLYRLEAGAAADELLAQEEEEASAVAGAPGTGRSLVATTFGGSGEANDRAGRNGTKVVVAVEWPERLSALPEDAWRLRLEYQGEGRRAHWREPESTPARTAGPAAEPS
jgi:tRNA threonylcarbamoyladenosine biosynthesis protein TsaE